jgi:hypothetical protein
MIQQAFIDIRSYSASSENLPKIQKIADCMEVLLIELASSNKTAAYARVIEHLNEYVEFHGSCGEYLDLLNSTASIAYPPWSQANIDDQV